MLHLKDSIARPRSPYNEIRLRFPSAGCMAPSFALFAALGCSGVRQSPAVVGASNSSIETPRGLPSPLGGSLRWPSVARLGDDWIVAANVFPDDTVSAIPRRALYLVNTRTGRMPIPEGDFLFAYPMPITTPDGTLHLFWAEGKTGPAPLNWPLNLVAVWHATFQGDRWSRPEAVAQGQYVSWQARAPQVVLDDEGHLHFVASLAGSAQGEGIVHFVLVDHFWRRHDTGIDEIYPSIASLGAGRMSLVTVRTDAHGQNQLIERRSTDNGVTWSPPQRVLSDSDTGPAYKPLVRFAGDRLSLAWLGERSAKGSMWRVAHRLALDAIWGAPATLEMSGVILNAPFATSRCGDAIALAEAIAPGGAPLIQRLVEEKGRITQRPFGDSLSLAPAVVVSDDRMFEMWNRASLSGRGYEPVWRVTSLCDDRAHEGSARRRASRSAAP